MQKEQTKETDGIKYGTWEYSDKYGVYICSNCNKCEISNWKKICSLCGAKMNRKEDKDA